MSGDDDEAKTVVLITTFIVPALMEDAFLAWWRLVKPAFALQPGFVSARLHRSLDGRERYRFVNIAEWRSDTPQRDTLTKIWSSAPKPTIPGFDWTPTLYEVVESV